MISGGRTNRWWPGGVMASFVIVAGCQSGTTASDSGVNPDSGLDSGGVLLCTLVDGTSCTRDGGGVGICCNGACVLTGDDSSNCDGCGRVCPVPSVCQGSTCSVGRIQSNCLDGGCASDLVCTAGYFCENPSCPAGEVGGYCALASGAEGTCCSGSCADRLMDDANCGQCGRACADGGYCLAGACFPNADCSTAKAGGRCRLTDTSVGNCCDGTCIDLGLTTQSCGTCGSGCPLEASCEGGVCRGPNPDPDAGPAICAEDGGVCAASSACVGGRCLAQVCALEPGGLCSLDAGGGARGGSCCSGSCADLSSDPLNCGACGHACDSGLCDGVCRAPVPDGGPAPDAGDAG